jgi:carbon monoxide dehydrogenase subunit G
MELEHSFTIPVPPEQAWPVLLDVEGIAPCMPGATVSSVDGDVVSGQIKVKVGPVTMTYAGSARFVERDEQAMSITLEASGRETRGAGTASATIRSSLQGEDGRTRVVVHTVLNVTGRPAQFGRGVMAEVGGKIIERFAANLAAQLAGGGPAAAGEGAASNGTASKSASQGAASNGAASKSASQGAASEGAPQPGQEAGPGPTAPGSGPGSLSVAELNLPGRAYHSLQREGIRTVAELAARSEQELLAIEGLGPQSVKEIRQKLAERGLELAAPAAGSRSARAAAEGATTPAGTVPGGGSRPAPTPRPPQEEAIDLLSVAGFPVLKRVLPVAAALLAVLAVLARIRHRRAARS